MEIMEREEGQREGDRLVSVIGKVIRACMYVNGEGTGRSTQTLALSLAFSFNYILFNLSENFDYLLHTKKINTIKIKLVKFMDKYSQQVL